MPTSSVLGNLTSTNYKATHEFVSGTQERAPKEVKASASSRSNKLERWQPSNQQPSQTEVKTAEGTWSLSLMTRHLKSSMEQTQHFVGTWEFTWAQLKILEILVNQKEGIVKKAELVTKHRFSSIWSSFNHRSCLCKPSGFVLRKRLSYS